MYRDIVKICGKINNLVINNFFCYDVQGSCLGRDKR